MNSKSNNDFNTMIVLEKLNELIDDNVISKSFIEGLEVKTINSKESYIIFKEANDCKYMKKNYENEIDQAMKHAFGIVVKYKITYREEFKKIVGKYGTLSVYESNLSNRYQFKDYVEGEFNKNVVALGKKIINQDSTSYNPIFIYSSSGLGKTHFLHGIGNELVKKDKIVCYVNPDSFLKKVVQHLMNSDQEKLSEIIDYYKNIDVLLFDDIQQYGSRDATLNVLFNILNFHIEKGNQIVIAADKNPNLLGGFEERFITRFQGGITEEIKQPSLNDLMKIFHEKLIQNNLKPENWETEAIKFIVRNHSSSIRTLEGAINKIEWNEHKDISNIKYTYQVVSQMFSSLSNEHKDINPDKILQIVSKYYGINKGDILGKSRKKEIVLARHISMWMIRNMMNLTYKEIGAYFKGKDHSTVITAIEKIDYQMKINETVKNTLKLIKSKLM